MAERLKVRKSGVKPGRTKPPEFTCSESVLRKAAKEAMVDPEAASVDNRILAHAQHRMWSRYKKVLVVFDNPSLEKRILDRLYRPRRHYRWTRCPGTGAEADGGFPTVPLDAPLEEWPFARHLQHAFDTGVLTPKIEYAKTKRNHNTTVDAALVRKLAGTSSSAGGSAWSPIVFSAWGVQIEPVTMYRWVAEPAPPRVTFHESIGQLGKLPDSSVCLTAAGMAEHLTIRFNISAAATENDVELLSENQIEAVTNDELRERYYKFQLLVRNANGIGGVVKCN